MPLIDTNVPNLINGVSQQADALRFPSQCDAQINALSSVVDGLTKRPFTEHVGQLYNSGQSSAFGSGPVPTNLNASFPLCHLITPASTLERFALILGAGLKGGGNAGTRPRIWRLSDGVEIPIKENNGTNLEYSDYSDYLFATPPKTEEEYYAPSVLGPGMRAMTLGDYTFIVNTSVKVKLDAEVDTAPAPSALLFIKTLRRGGDYSIKLYNDPSLSSPSYNVSVDDIDTDPDRDPVSGDPIVRSQGHLAKQLLDALDTAGAGGTYNYTQKEGVIRIRRVDGADFKVEVTSTVTDGFVAFKNTVQAFNLLPKQGYAGFSVEVKGDPERDGDSYWVKYVADDPNLSGFVSGSWQETVKPGLQNKLDAATLPWALIYTSDENGTRFIWKKVPWVSRTAGDDDTNPAPSFVGRTIDNLFFWRGRLGILSGENVIMSESNEFFNFWRTSVVSLLDADPIDVSVSHPKVSTLRDAIPNSERLVLTCDEAQFTLDGGDLLTPKSASTKLVSDYSISRKARPLSLGNAILLPFGRGGGSSINDDGVLTPFPSDVGAVGETVTAGESAASGGYQGLLPYRVAVTFDEALGEVTLNYNAFSVPDRFVVYYDGIKVIDTGYRGDTSYDTDLTDLGLTATEGLGSGTATFSKYSSTQNVAYVDVYAPLDGTAWNFSLSTPDTEVAPTAPDTGGGLRLKTYDIPKYSGVLQYFIQTDTGLYSGSDITSHVPRFIERPIRKMVGSETEGLVIVLTDWNLVDPRNSCYVYRFYDKGGQRLQSSWSIFKFADTDHILDVFIVNATVYFVIARDLKVFLEKMDIASAIRDADSDYAVLLDRRITDEGLTKSYDAVTNRTTITLPYAPTERGIEVVTRFTPEFTNGGFRLPATLVGSTVTLSGNHTETPLHLGEPYTMTYEMTKPTLRTQSNDGSFVVNTGRFQVRRGYLSYDNSLFFRVTVTPLYRDPYVYEFEGKKVGVGNTLVERPIELSDGQFSFPVLSKNDQVTVVITNDSPYPSNLLSVDWEALYQVRSQRQ